MNQAETVNAFLNIKDRLDAVGLTVLTDINGDAFFINDASKAKGQLRFETIGDLDNFTRGYELGYESSL
mgnify:CR=1 FL=1